jgi:hypothetical protein
MSSARGLVGWGGEGRRGEWGGREGSERGPAQAAKATKQQRRLAAVALVKALRPRPPRTGRLDHVGQAAVDRHDVWVVHRRQHRHLGRDLQRLVLAVARRHDLGRDRHAVPPPPVHHAEAAVAEALSDGHVGVGRDRAAALAPQVLLQHLQHRLGVEAVDRRHHRQPPRRARREHHRRAVAAGGALEVRLRLRPARAAAEAAALRVGRRGRGRRRGERRRVAVPRARRAVAGGGGGRLGRGRGGGGLGARHAEAVRARELRHHGRELVGAAVELVVQHRRDALDEALLGHGWLDCGGRLGWLGGRLGCSSAVWEARPPPRPPPPLRAPPRARRASPLAQSARGGGRAPPACPAAP